MGRDRPITILDRDTPIGVYFEEIEGTINLSISEERRLFAELDRVWPDRLASAPPPGKKRERAFDTPIPPQAKPVVDEIITHLLRLVVSEASKYNKGALPLSDLIQEGNTGLLLAIVRFEPDRGWRLTTYAVHWIRQRISRSFIEQGRTIRVPVHMNDRMVNLKRTINEYKMAHGYEPSLDELIKLRPDLDEKQLRDTLHKLSTVGVITSLDSDPGIETEGNSGDYYDILADPVSIEDAVEDSQLREAIMAALDTLDPREAGILARRFGLIDGVSMKLNEIGEMYGVTRERIRQIEAQALEKLRAGAIADKLRDFIS